MTNTLRAYKFHFIYFAIMVLSSLNRLVNLGLQKVFIGDEKYYVKDGWSILNYGYETSWAKDYNNFNTLEKDLSSSSEMFYTPQIPIPVSLEYWSTHGPVGKMLIGLGMLPFQHNDSFGWRFSAAVAGIIITALTMLVAYKLFKNHAISAFSGLFVAIDTLNIAMSRIAYLDIFVTLFFMLSLLITIKIIQKDKDKILLYILLGVTVGLGGAVKWSMFFTALPLFIWLFVAAIYKNKKLSSVLPIIISGVVVVLSYMVAWLPWLFAFAINKTGSLQSSLQYFLNDHVYKYNYAMIFTGTSPNKSRASEWLVASNPSIFGSNIEAASEKIYYSSMPNMLLWILGVSSLAYIFYLVYKRKINAITLVIPIGILYLNFIPWVFYDSRIIYQWYSILYEPLVMIGAGFIIYSIRYIAIRLILIALIVLYPLALNNAYGGKIDSYNTKVVLKWKEISASLGLYDLGQANPLYYPSTQRYLSENPEKEAYFEGGILKFRDKTR